MLTLFLCSYAVLSKYGKIDRRRDRIDRKKLFAQQRDAVLPRGVFLRLQRRHTSKDNLRALHIRAVRQRPQPYFKAQSDHLLAPTPPTARRRHCTAKTRRKSHLLFNKKPKNRGRPARRSQFSEFVSLCGLRAQTPTRDFVVPRRAASPARPRWGAAPLPGKGHCPFGPKLKTRERRNFSLLVRAFFDCMQASKLLRESVILT